MLKTTLYVLFFLHCFHTVYSQNGMVGDGFGGRLWYKPTRFSVGSYSAYTICGDTSDPQNNQLFGWGSNNKNQLGLGVSISGVNLPTPIPEMDSVAYYSTGYLMGAIKYDQSGWMWGADNFSTGSYIVQYPINIISNVFFCDASSTTVSFVKTDSTVWSVGYNTFGNFGSGITDNIFHLVPVQMQSVSNAVRVANNGLSTSVLLGDSSIVTTGTNQIGLGPLITSTTVPLPNPFLPKIVDVKSNTFGTVALAANGDVYFWGVDNNIQYNTPVKIDSLSNIVAISGCDDGYHFLALDANKNCFGWGNEYPISFSANYPITIQDPILVATDVIDIMAGETFSYIVKSDNSLWASGFSNEGSIWLNLSNEPRAEFTQLDPESVPGWCTPFDPSVINFPNVFTPNGDLVNDLFFFENYQLEELNATIINRWGNVVATLNDPNDSWDGNTSGGQPCDDGVYFFVVNYKYPEQDWMTAHGHITLIR